MELRELFRNRLFLVFSFFLAACSGPPEHIYYSDPLLSRERGNLYYDGELYTGMVCEETPDGQLLAEDHIIGGKKNGTCKKWWPNGQLKSEAEFSNGDYHGTVIHYYESGSLFSVFRYDHGHESGLQQMWKSDGRIKANYEVVNGRKYGLTGVKNCVNVLEEDNHNF